jgi:hypothetical protein
MGPLVRLARPTRGRYDEHLRAGIDTLYVDRLPAQIEVTLLARLWLLEDETGHIELQVFGPDTTPLGTLPFEIHPEPGPNHRPGYLVTQTEALELGFLAETDGTYSVEVYADRGRGDAVSEERRRSLFFNVRVAESD